MQIHGDWKQVSVVLKNVGFGDVKVRMETDNSYIEFVMNSLDLSSMADLFVAASKGEISEGPNQR